MRRHFAGAVLLALQLSLPAAAQDARLTETFRDASTLSALSREMDAARRQGLPVEALVQKSLEGRSKGAADHQILTAVGALRDRMATARGVLGTGADTTVLVAAASVLYLGIQQATLHQLAESAPPGSLATALVVLGDLGRRGVPLDRAGAILRDLARAGAGSALMSEYREQVDADIQNGASASRAAQVRLQGMLARLSAESRSLAGARP